MVRKQVWLETTGIVGRRTVHVRDTILLLSREVNGIEKRQLIWGPQYCFSIRVGRAVFTATSIFLLDRKLYCGPQKSDIFISTAPNVPDCTTFPFPSVSVTDQLPCNLATYPTEFPTPHTLILKMKGTCSSEKSVTSARTCGVSPGDQSLNNHCSENLKMCNFHVTYHHPS